MAIQGVILDVDGTLVLSNDAHAEAWSQAFAAHGVSVSFDQARPLVGMGGDQLVPRLAPSLNAHEGLGKAIAETRASLFRDRYAPQLTAAPGARPLVERMRQEGLRLIVGSSAKRDELRMLLDIAGVTDLLPDAVTADDAQRSKPAADVVAVALQRISLAPDQTLMLGDTPYDIESAGKVGVGVVALRCGGFSDRQLAHARARYNDPADLLAHYDASPLGQAHGSQS